MENINFSPEQIAHFTGRDNISNFTRANTPILQFSGKTGEYSIVENKEEFKLGNFISGVVIKVRKCMWYFPDGGAYSLSTPDGDAKTIVPLWVRQPNQRTQTPMRGTFTELKAKYPQLKMCPVLYIILEGKGELVKLTVKGKSSSILFNYYQEFDKKKDEYLDQYITEFSAAKDEYQNKKTGEIKKFWVAMFTKGKKVEDEMAIILKAKELTEKLESVEIQFSNTKTIENKEQETEIDVSSMFEN